MRLGMAIDYTREPLRPGRRDRGARGSGSRCGLGARGVGLRRSRAAWLPGGADDADDVIAAGVLPVHTRTPSLIAQTAAGLAALSGGRFELGLGTSGPQVVEGFTAYAFRQPPARVRDTIGVSAAPLWSGATSRYDGQAVRRSPQTSGTGLGRPLRLLAPGGRRPHSHPPCRDAPGDGRVGCGDRRWVVPAVLHPDAAEASGGRRANADAQRAIRRSGRWRSPSSMACAIGGGSDVDAARDSIRPFIARYVGGMGARGANYYTDVIAALGWGSRRRAIQELYLGGHREPRPRRSRRTCCGH